MKMEISLFNSTDAPLHVRTINGFVQLPRVGEKIIINKIFYEVKSVIHDYDIGVVAVRVQSE